MGFRGYLELAGFVVCMFFVCAALWLWRDKDNAKANLIAAQATIGAQAVQIKDDRSTIKLITALRSSDDNIMSEFDAKLDAMNKHFGALDNNIANLRRNNADVEKYLSLPIPDALLAILSGVPLGQAAAGNEPAPAK